MKLIEKAKIGFMDAILKNDSIEALCEAAYELLNWPMIVGRDTGDVLLMLPNEPIGLKRYDELQKSRKVPMEIFIGHQKKIGRGFEYYEDISFIEEKGTKYPLEITMIVSSKNDMFCQIVFHVDKEAVTDEEMDALVGAMEGKPGDLLLFAADKNKVVYDVLGALRVELAKQMDLLDKNEYRFVWVTEFPLLEWNEEENRYTAMHHPFTMLMDEDIPLIESGDLGKIRAKAYDIVLNGNEIGGGSVRIHQNDIQEKMFEMLGFTREAAYEQFGFLLNAFKYGVPPHAGLAYGLDRLVMLMAKVDSIRDVIAFPKVKDASCLMTESPSRVSEQQLKELGLEVEPETEE